MTSYLWCERLRSLSSEHSACGAAKRLNEPWEVTALKSFILKPRGSEGIFGDLNAAVKVIFAIAGILFVIIRQRRKQEA